jgi:hypothetical protein
MSDNLTIYISIGNSDDKLSQLEWCRFAEEVDRAVTRAARYAGVHVHGRWYSLPTEPWQNACWCLEFHAELVAFGHPETLRSTLAKLCVEYRQESIAWAEATVSFVTPYGGEPGA